MLRFLNLVAIAALISSAVYAYTIKYQTSYRAEQIAKTKIEIKAESDATPVASQASVNATAASASKTSPPVTKSQASNEGPVSSPERVLSQEHKKP
ncbi:MAG: hypothetical protein EBT19_05155 [Methylocystaceae bacterium]|nr:hypothetical protein [Methylocystaceae bacterium]